MKKFLSIILVVVLSLSICQIALADVNSDEYAQNKVDNANAKIEKIVEKAQASDKDDAQKAADKANKTAEKAIISSENKDAVVECEYIDYEIDGQIVSIDPLKVIRF